MDLYHIFIGVAAGRLRFSRKRVQCGHISDTVPGSPSQDLPPHGRPHIRVMTPCKVMAEILLVGPFEFFDELIT